MNRIRLSRVFGLTITALVLAPAAAFAQSAIGRQVRDNTGAVLPGATVAAASPALIEGKREGTTDGQGRYSIVDLRPGVYTVTFTLQDFTTMVREGIDLPSNFTATVDVTLSVGSLAETVTVTGDSPLVDVQQTARTQVLSREELGHAGDVAHDMEPGGAPGGRADHGDRSRRLARGGRPAARNAQRELRPANIRVINRRDSRLGHLRCCVPSNIEERPEENAMRNNTRRHQRANLTGRSISD